jgi:hypothetical protein
MSMYDLGARFAWVGLACVLLARPVDAIPVNDLKGFDELYGRYAPAGDCKRQPQVVVDATGFSFEVAGKRELVTNPEFAASYGPRDYDGIAKWFFPFRKGDGYPILMSFNGGEVKGTLAIDPQDEGWPGGPPLSAFNAALVKGSPYARCKQAP